MSYLVGLWASGAAGGLMLRAITEHPELELAGVVTADPRRAGLAATEDPAGLLARRPHVICYTGGSADDLRLMLQAGASVVSNAVPELVDPASADPVLVRRLRSACATGGSACLTIGPGMVGDVLPVLLSGVCRSVDGITVTEFRTSPDGGFGGPIGRRPPVVRAGAPGRKWGPVVRLLARHLAVPLDGIAEAHEVCAAPEEIDGPCGPIGKGTLAGLRYRVSGMLRRRPVITVERVVRARGDLAPHWPAPPLGGPGHRVEIAGEPPVRMDLAAPGGSHAAALRMVNAVRAVAEAPPGLHTPLDLPVFSGRRLLR
ncbi:hypothetical protein [Actinomadura sp.]|uniref:hypothetical protein n=1 Tax=Actinomadura sp. TaxID=1989 RepID=UPI0037C75EE6